MQEKLMNFLDEKTLIRERNIQYWPITLLLERSKEAKYSVN